MSDLVEEGFVVRAYYEVDGEPYRVLYFPEEDVEGVQQYTAGEGFVPGNISLLMEFGTPITKAEFQAMVVTLTRKKNP